MSKPGRDTIETSPSRTEQLLKQLLQQTTALHNNQRFAALGPERIFEFLYADKIFRMYLPFANTDLIQRYILMHGHFFELSHLTVVQEMIPPKAVVIDAGANIGNHTLFFAEICGAGRVYSFEPLRETFRILERNIALNRLINVTPVNAALGEQPGRARLGAYTAANIGKSSFQAGGEGGYEMTSIDTLGLERLDFLKMDVEGGHVPALRGARETIVRCRPLILIELRQNHGEFASGAATLESMGYRLKQSLGPNDHLFIPE
jgi:FkbM family methyltransferase